MLEATTGFEPVMEVLQTSALPLGYVAAETTLRRMENPPGGNGRTWSIGIVGAEKEI